MLEELPVNGPTRRFRGCGERLAFAGLLVLGLAACDDYPRDPAGTLEEVRGGTLSVGLIEARPWVDLRGAEPGGVEVELARALADSLDATAQWVRGSPGEVFAALQKRHIDLVIGGLTADSPWASRAAFTRPYYVEALVVAGPPGEPFEAIDEVRVAVPPATVLAAYVADQGGVAVPPGAADAATPLTAKPAWQLGPDETGRFLLHEAGHVFAVPQGENAWLMAIDRFLKERTGRVRAALEAGTP